MCVHTQFTAEKAIVREVRGDHYRESESEGTRRERSQREPVVAADPGTGCGELSCAKLASACMCAALHDDLI